MSSFSTCNEYILCRDYLSCCTKSGIIDIYQKFRDSRALKTYLRKVNKYWKNRKISTMPCNRRSCLIFDFIYDKEIFPTKSWYENSNLKWHAWLEYSENNFLLNCKSVEKQSYIVRGNTKFWAKFNHYGEMRQSGPDLNVKFKRFFNQLFFKFPIQRSDTIYSLKCKNEKNNYKKY